MVACPRRSEDQLVWASTKNGDFTIRSTYHIAYKSDRAEEGNFYNVHELKTAWKAIWRIKGSRMVKTFLWQACNNIMSTKELLFKRRITPDFLCPICGLVAESIDHILWSCPSTKDVWTECPSKISKCMSDETSFIHIITQLVARVDEDEMQLLATIARLIWLGRNFIVLMGEMIGPATIVQRAKEQVEAWCQANQREP